jgi:hypothetical protein
MTKMYDAIILIVDAVVDGVGNLIGWAMIGIGAFLVELYRRFRKLRSDVDDLDRYLTGDSSDPDSPGLLEKVDRCNSSLDEMKDEMETQHRETERKLNKLLDGRDD